MTASRFWKSSSKVVEQTTQLSIKVMKKIMATTSHLRPCSCLQTRALFQSLATLRLRSLPVKKVLSVLERMSGFSSQILGATKFSRDG